MLITLRALKGLSANRPSNNWALDQKGYYHLHPAEHAGTA